MGENVSIPLLVRLKVLTPKLDLSDLHKFQFHYWFDKKKITKMKLEILTSFNSTIGSIKSKSSGSYFIVHFSFNSTIGSIKSLNT